jgi:hypothetical protein
MGEGGDHPVLSEESVGRLSAADIHGKEEIRTYWSRQWKEFDAHVEPIAVIDRGAGKIDIRVHQLVKSLSGDVLSDSGVWHRYTVADGRIERMDIGGSEADSEQSPSSAFPIADDMAIFPLVPHLPPRLGSDGECDFV